MKISKKDISLPEKIADYVVNMQDDPNELRVLVYALSSKDGIESSETAAALGMDEQDVISAVSFWRGMGLLNVGGKTDMGQIPANSTADTVKSVPASVRDTDTKTYTGEEIARLFEQRPELHSLLDFAQTRLGRVFSPSDVAKLVYLEDYVLMTPPMIMSIIDYCVELDKKSMRYVEKTALSLYDEGINTYEALEEYFDKKKKAKSNEGLVRSIMGIGERNFTSAEKVHISKWFGEYESTCELITLAYEKTIASISKPSVPYMSKLLQRWHESGYKTVDEVNNGAAAARGTKNTEQGAFNETIPAVKKHNTDNTAGLSLEDFFENN